MGQIASNPFDKVLLVGGPAWRLSGSLDLSAVLGALPRLVPELTRVHIFCPNIASAVYEALVPFAQLSVHGAIGFERVALDVAPEVFVVLAELAAAHAGPEVCEHLIGYAHSDRVLEWFDIPDDPIYVAETLPDFRIRRVARELSLSCMKLR